MPYTIVYGNMAYSVYIEEWIQTMDCVAVPIITRAMAIVYGSKFIVIHPRTRRECRDTQGIRMSEMKRERERKEEKRERERENRLGIDGEIE